MRVFRVGWGRREECGDHRTLVDQEPAEVRQERSELRALSCTRAGSAQRRSELSRVVRHQGVEWPPVERGHATVACRDLVVDSPGEDRRRRLTHQPDAERDALELLGYL